MGQNQSAPGPTHDELLGGKQFKFQRKKLQDEYIFRERESGLQRKFNHHQQGKTILGEGSFGTVRRATNRATGMSRAVKTIEKNVLNGKGMTRRDVIMEAELLKMCDHELIMKSFEAYETSKQFHLVLELCNGGSLGERVTKANAGDISEDLACRWMKSVLKAIRYLHGPDIGICHRDIKPDNFFFHDEELKLGDFGVAIRPKRRGSIITQKVGTPAFMAPEIHLLPDRSRGYNIEADLWSAGVVMLFILTAKCPFINEDGFLLKNAIIDGRLPMWENKKHYGLFQAFQKGTVAPSKQAQDLIRLLLKPDPRRRVDAETAVSHAWFSANAMGTLAPAPAGVPMLSSYDFQNSGLFGDLFAKARNVAMKVSTDLGAAAEELELNVNIRLENLYNKLEDMPAPVMNIEKRVDLAKYEDRFAKCCVCLRDQAEAANQEFDYVCKQCNNVVCVECLPKLRDLKCPICRLPAESMEIERALIGMYNSSMKAVAEIKETSLTALKKAEDCKLPKVSLGAPIGYKNEEALDKCTVCRDPSTWDAFACPKCARCICESCINGLTGIPSVSSTGERMSVFTNNTTQTTALSSKRPSGLSSTRVGNISDISPKISHGLDGHLVYEASPAKSSRDHLINDPYPTDASRRSSNTYHVPSEGHSVNLKHMLSNVNPRERIMTRKEELREPSSGPGSARSSYTDIPLDDGTVSDAPTIIVSDARTIVSDAHTQVDGAHVIISEEDDGIEFAESRSLEDASVQDRSPTTPMIDGKLSPTLRQTVFLPLPEHRKSDRSPSSASGSTGMTLSCASSASRVTRLTEEEINSEMTQAMGIKCCPHCADTEAFEAAIENYRLSRNVATAAAKVFTRIKEDIQHVDYRGIAQGVQNEARNCLKKTSSIGQAISEISSAVGSEVLHDARSYKDLPWELAAAASEKSAHQKLEHIDLCICCQQASSGTDFVCPKCSAAVCSICIRRTCCPRQSCKHCGDTEAYASAISNHQFLLEQWSNVSNVVGGMLQKLNSSIFA